MVSWCCLPKNPPTGGADDGVGVVPGAIDVLHTGVVDACRWVLAIWSDLQSLYDVFRATKAQELACYPIASYEPHCAVFEAIDLDLGKA